MKRAPARERRGEENAAFGHLLHGRDKSWLQRFVAQAARSSPRAAMTAREAEDRLCAMAYTERKMSDICNYCGIQLHVWHLDF